MKRILPAFACLCLLASCASVPPRSVSDRFGIMKIDIPGDYYDDSPSYLQDAEKARVSRGRPQDPGIKSLLMVKRGDDRAYCKFRQLRYLPNEVGYTWEMDRLATEVARAFNRIFTTHGPADYFKLGIGAPVGEKTADRTELVSSSAVTVNGYSAWQVTYNHWVHPQLGLTRAISQNRTVVIRMSADDAGAPKFYLVAECAAGGLEAEVNSSMREITQVLNTVQFGSKVQEENPTIP